MTADRLGGIDVTDYAGWRRGDAALVVRQGLQAAFPDLDLADVPMTTPLVTSIFVGQGVADRVPDDARPGDSLLDLDTGLLSVIPFDGGKPLLAWDAPKSARCPTCHRRQAYDEVDGERVFRPHPSGSRTCSQPVGS